MSFDSTQQFGGAVMLPSPSSAITRDQVSCSVLSVRTRPFALPRGLLHSGSAVSCAVTDAPGAQTVAILVTKKVAIDNAAEMAARSAAAAAAAGRSADETGAADGGRPHLRPGHIDGALVASGEATAVSLSQAPTDTSSSMIIQKISLQDPIVVWRCARFLRLSAMLSPQACPNVLPVIASYRYGGMASSSSAYSPSRQPHALDRLGTSNTNIAVINGSAVHNVSGADPLAKLIDPATAAVYIAQPHVADTLAALASSAPCSAVQPAQLRVIARELLDALSLLHRNGIVVNDLSPSTIRVNAALKARTDVALCLSRPVLANTPMRAHLYLQLLEPAKYSHRYMAPEVVLQLIAASTARAVAPQGSDPAFYARSSSATVAVSAAADIWALGCVLVELATGRPLFAGSDSVFDHPRVVSDILGAPFPTRVPPPPPASTSSSSSSPTRLGVFTGVPISGALHAALQVQQQAAASGAASAQQQLSAAEAGSFERMVAAMLQMEPALRPTADELVRSPFISLGVAGNVAGGGGYMRAHGGAIVGRPRRNSATSSGSRPMVAAASNDPSKRPAAAVGGAAAAGGRAPGGIGAEPSLSVSTADAVASSWAIAEPGEEALEALMETAPVLP